MEFIRRHSPLIAVLDLVGILLFWVTLFVAGALTPGYSQMALATSRLSAAGEPYWWLNSLFGIVPVALAMIMTGCLVLARYRPGPLAWISGLATLIAGLAFVLPGVARCDVMCGPSDLLNAKLHVIGAAIGFNIILFGPLVLGLRSFSSRRRTFYSAALIVGAVYWAVLFFGISGRIEELRWLGFGFWQKTGIALLNAWIALVSIDVLVSDSPTDISSESR